MIATTPPQVETHSATAYVACVAGVPTGYFHYVTDVPGDLVVTPIDLDHYMTEQITLDGNVVYTSPSPRVVPGSGDFTVTLPALTGPHTMRAYTSWQGVYAGFADSTTVAIDCGAPPVTPGPGPIVTPGKVALRVHKTTRVLRAVSCDIAHRAYQIVKIKVVWTRAGVVVKTREHTFKKLGAVCAKTPPAVTG